MNLSGSVPIQPQGKLKAKQLNEWLSSLEDRGLMNALNVFLAPDFKLISELASYSIVKQPNFADIDTEFLKFIAPFFIAHKREEELLLWAISEEIQVTSLDSFSELFRMQSFATQMMFQLFFSNESGMKYLKRTAGIVVGSVMNLKYEKVEILPNNVSVSVEEANQNLQYILGLTADLFRLLEVELAYCPSEIRRGFLHMRTVAAAKFPEIGENVGPVVFFLRILCPTLLQPEQFGLTKEKPSQHAFSALLIISKLLQNIANGVPRNNISTYKPHNQMIINFIRKYFVVIQQFSAKLTDKDMIETDSKIATVNKKWSQDEKDGLFDSLYEYIFKGRFRLFLDCVETEETQMEKEREAHEKMITEFLEGVHKNMSNTDWSSKKPKNAVTLFTHKKMAGAFKLRGECSTNLEKVWVAIQDCVLSDWLEILGDKAFVTDKCWGEPGATGEEWVLRTRAAFPYADCVSRIRCIRNRVSNGVSIYFIPVQAGKLSGRKVKESSLSLVINFSPTKDPEKCEIGMFFGLDSESPVTNILGKELAQSLRKLSTFIVNYTQQPQHQSNSLLMPPTDSKGAVSSTESSDNKPSDPTTLSFKALDLGKITEERDGELATPTVEISPAKGRAELKRHSSERTKKAVSNLNKSPQKEKMNLSPRESPKRATTSDGSETESLSVDLFPSPSDKYMSRKRSASSPDLLSLYNIQQ